MFSLLTQFGANKILVQSGSLGLFIFDLWFRGEVHLVVLRVVFHYSFFGVEISQILILVRIGMIIESIHPLVSTIMWFRLIWHFKTAVIQNLVDLFSLKILQVFEVDHFKNTQLLLGEFRIILLVG